MLWIPWGRWALSVRVERHKLDYRWGKFPYRKTPLPTFHYDWDWLANWNHPDVDEEEARYVKS